MTLLEAAKQALDVLQSEYSIKGTNKYNPWDTIEALRQAIEQAEKQEWVGLTDEERSEIRGRVQNYMDMDDVNYGKHIQIATEEWLKEKNG